MVPSRVLGKWCSQGVSCNDLKDALGWWLPFSQLPQKRTLLLRRLASAVTMLRDSFKPGFRTIALRMSCGGQLQNYVIWQRQKKASKGKKRTDLQTGQSGAPSGSTQSWWRPSVREVPTSYAEARRYKVAEPIWIVGCVCYGLVKYRLTPYAFVDLLFSINIEIINQLMGAIYLMLNFHEFVF